jgi:5-methylcytosine-specific restriction endonuclease McrA
MRGLGVPVDERCNRRYDWSKVQAFYDEGHSVAECKACFGFSSQSWNAARRRGDIVSRPVGMPLGALVTGDRNRSHLKARLLRMGVTTNACELCGISTWRGKPLSLALHHINGRGQDNRLENLQLLCPNCHSQTENFGGRNRRRAAGQVGAA